MKLHDDLLGALARAPRAAARAAPRAALVGGFGGDLHTFEHALPAALRAYAASVGAAAAAAAVGALVAPAPLLLAVIPLALHAAGAQRLHAAACRELGRGIVEARAAWVAHARRTRGGLATVAAFDAGRLFAAEASLRLDALAAARAAAAGARRWARARADALGALFGVALALGLLARAAAAAAFLRGVGGVAAGGVALALAARLPGLLAAAQQQAAALEAHGPALERVSAVRRALEAGEA